MIEDWILVYQADEEYQAEIMRQLLEKNGLHPVVMDKKDDEFRIGVVSVYIAPQELSQAKSIINSTESE